MIVPARNAAATLRDAVASAITQHATDELEVVIAVGPSADATAAVAAELSRGHPQVVVVDNPSGTTPAALNLAFAATRAPVLVRLDAHAQLPPGYVETAVRELERDPRVGNVGGRQVPTAQAGFARAVALAMMSRAGSGGATYRHGARPADVDTVYLGVFRRQALEEVGGFDERLLRNQDYELNHRLRAAGWRVRYLPDLAVAYRPRSTLFGLWRQYRDYGAWKRRVLGLHPGSVRLRQLVAPALVLALATTAALAVAAGVRWPLFAVTGTYALAVGAAAVHAARAELRRAPAVAVALTTMHVAWGVGFLLGRTRSRAS